MEKKVTRKEQAVNTRKKILAVCTEILSKRTFDEMNITMICKKANISVGAFYHHFKNKADIIIELYRDVDVYFVDEILPACLEREPAEGIIYYLCEQCQYAQRMGVDSMKNVYKAQVDNGNSFFASNARGLPEGLRELIVRAKEAGRLKQSVDIDVLLEQLLILSRGVIYYWCIRDGKMDMIDYVRQMAKNYLVPFEENM